MANHINAADAGDEVDATGDAGTATNNFDAYILPTGNDKLVALNTSNDALMRAFGTPAIFDSQTEGFGSNAFSDLGLDASSAQMRALGKMFNSTPENVAAIIAAFKPEEIPPAEQNARCAAAHQECMEAMANIAKGSANAGDLASLLSSYSTLNGFAKGSFAQSYVNAAIGAVRQGMAAVAENNAHPTGLSNAEVLHLRLNRFQVDWREKQRLANA